MNRQQALTVIEQLGGNEFKAMVGVKTFIFSESGLSFGIGRNCHKINVVHIQLEPTDEYSVEFLRVSKKGMQVVSRYENVYWSDLKEIFEKATGLYTSLF